MVLSLPQSYIVKPFATILKDLPQPCWHWLTGGTFDSATGGTFQSDTDGTFHSDIPGTFESDMGGTFKVLQSHKKRAIDLLTGNSYKVIRPIDKDYIELENGIISGISHKILVSYGKPDASDTTTVWLDKKYITPDENGIPPYSCTKIIGDIVYFSPNISEGTFDILSLVSTKNL